MSTNQPKADIWQLADAYIQSATILVDQHKTASAEMLMVHARTLQTELARRMPEKAAEGMAYLDITIKKIKDGELPDAMRDLSIGIIRVLPETQAGVMDDRLVGLFAHTDKEEALRASFKPRAGIAPMVTQFLLRHSFHPAAKYYATKLNDVFPDTQGIVPAIL